MTKTTEHINDEPNPPIWSDSVKIFRPPTGNSTTDLERMQQELHQYQDPELTYNDDTTQRESQKTFTCDDHFSRRRTALLFAPGIYPNLHFQVGYYVQVLGLGEHVNDVQFQRRNDYRSTAADNAHGSRLVGPYIPALNKHLHQRGHDQPQQSVGTSLDSFWRGAENFSVTGYNDDDEADLMWAASQAASLRRCHITGDLYLHDQDAYASGGHLANAQVDGTIFMGGQQQYLVRNVHIGSNATGGAWSMVYVGCTGRVPQVAPTPSNGPMVTVVDHARVRVEKPYIVMTNELFQLRVPQVKYCDDSTFTNNPVLASTDDEMVRDFTTIRVVRDTEPIGRIQDALDDGKDVILCPGIYELEASIVIRQPNQILFGLGLATLVAPKNGSPCICVAHNTPGVRLAGLMLEATELDRVADSENENLAKESSALLVWGDTNERSVDTSDVDNQENPGAMFDIYIRVGGVSSTNAEKINRANVAVHNMMYIHSDYVIGDNLWLWRADHAELDRDESCNYPNISPIFWQTESHEYRVQHGLVVTGNDVTIFGLAVEHTNNHQTIWSGERGAVYFYQCELPYDYVTKPTKDKTDGPCNSVLNTHDDSASDFSHSGTTIDICGFCIQPNVQVHTLYAAGIYSNFRNEEVYAATGIVHPNHPFLKVINPFTVKLDNLGGIKSIVNGKGKGTDQQGMPVRFDD